MFNKGKGSERKKRRVTFGSSLGLSLILFFLNFRDS